MISIIICSINKSFLEAVKNNISDTIGVEHEVIAIDNLTDGKSICTVYNTGIEIAKYPLLCFVHEDIELKTNNWGIKIIEIFKDENVGLVGVAGSTYRSAVPSGWFPPSEFETKPWRLNINQGSKYQSREEKHEYFNPLNEKISRVACVDGVCLFTTKKIAQQIKFDDKLLKGFHGYDIDFSLSVGENYKVLVTYNVLLTHASEGNFNEQWLKEIIRVHGKHNLLLPINYEGYSNNEVNALEKKAFRRFLKELIKNKNFSCSERKEFIKGFYKQNKINTVDYLKYLYRIN